MAELRNVLPESCQADFKLIRNSFTEEALGESRITQWKGRRFEPDFPAETIKYAYDHHEPKDNDILIASFPKTGTTWTREIVRQILYGRDEKLNAVTKDLSFPVIYLESGKPSKFNVVNNLPLPRRYYVTHLPTELLNMNKYNERNMKIIYTLRNPKDQLVSFYHHLQNFPLLGDMAQFADKNWNSYFVQEMEGRFPHNLKEGETYLDHILSWLPYIKQKKSVLMVVYEEMMQNPIEHVKMIADFLKVDLPASTMKDIAINCSLDNMKKAAATSTSEDAEFQREFGLLRKGKVGAWKEYFTVEQSEILDKKVEEKLVGTGIKFIYE